MLAQRRVLTTISVIALTAIFMQFQNCAPASIQTAETGSDEQPVMISDDVHNKSIQFISQTVEVKDGIQSAVISGLCNRMHNAAKLNWTVLAVGGQNSATVSAGQSACERGQFGIVLNSMHELECGAEHILSVQGDWGGATSARIIRRCQALASQELYAPEGSPYGTECALEYLPGSEDGSNCNQVCYRDQKVVLKQNLAAEQCAGLIERLAGP